MSDTNGATEGKKVRRATYTNDLENMTLTQTVLGGRTRIFSVADAPADMVKRLTLHGLRQKLGDGHAARETDVASATDRIWDSIVAGMWTTRGESVERTTMFVTAYANVTKTDVDAVRARVNDIESGEDKEAQAKLDGMRKHPSIVAEMERLRIAAAQERMKAARAAGKDAGELLAL